MEHNNSDIYVLTRAFSVFKEFMADTTEGNVVYREDSKETDDLIYNMFCNAYQRGRSDEIQLLTKLTKQIKEKNIQA